MILLAWTYQSKICFPYVTLWYSLLVEYGMAAPMMMLLKGKVMVTKLPTNHFASGWSLGSKPVMLCFNIHLLCIKKVCSYVIQLYRMISQGTFPSGIAIPQLCPSQALYQRQTPIICSWISAAPNHLKTFYIFGGHELFRRRAPFLDRDI